jgi:hypothetical protein
MSENDATWSAVPSVFGAIALGTIAGTMDWLGFSDGNHMKPLGTLVWMTSHVLLVVLLQRHARRSRTWLVGLVGAILAGVVLGGVGAFVLGLSHTPLYEGHWSFG